MNMIQFPTKPLRLTESEYKQFIALKIKMKNAITPGEATWYKNELDALISLSRRRK